MASPDLNVHRRGMIPNNDCGLSNRMAAGELERACSGSNCPSSMRSARTRARILRTRAAFAIRPFDAIGIGEEADLLVGREHLEPFANDLGDRIGKEVMPPVSGQAEIRQFARQRAHGLIRVTTGQQALEAQPGMSADHLGDLADRPLGQPAARLERQGFGAKTELEDDLFAVGLQCRQERLVDV